MTITLNGDAHELVDGTTIAALVTELTGRDRGSAVAVDGEVVPRSAWSDTPLHDGQAVELITAVQGG